MLLASGDMLVLDEFVLLEPGAGDVAVPSPLVPPAGWPEDESELLGAAGTAWPVGLFESPVGYPDCVPDGLVADELASGLVAEVFGDDPSFRRWLDRSDRPYVLATRSPDRVAAGPAGAGTVDEIVHGVPDAVWQHATWQHGEGREWVRIPLPQPAGFDQRVEPAREPARD